MKLPDLFVPVVASFIAGGVTMKACSSSYEEGLLDGIQQTQELAYYAGRGDGFAEAQAATLFSDLGVLGAQANLSLCLGENDALRGQLDLTRAATAQLLLSPLDSSLSCADQLETIRAVLLQTLAIDPSFTEEPPLSFPQQLPGGYSAPEYQPL